MRNFLLAIRKIHTIDPSQKLPKYLLLVTWSAFVIHKKGLSLLHGLASHMNSRQDD